MNSMGRCMKLLLIWLSLSILGMADTAIAPLEKVRLQLQWKHQFEFAGFYAAKENGYYRDVGLDVEFIEYDVDDSISDIVLSGRVEYGLSYSSIIATYIEGKPIVFVANFFKQSPLVLIAQKSINTPLELKGKKVMGVSDNIDNITLVSMLSKFGVSFSDIDSLPTSFGIDEFIDKKIEAMSAFTTNELFELTKRGVPYRVFDPTVYGTKYYDLNLFTSKKEATTNPDRVQKMKEASIRGWEYALSHKEEIADLILEKYNTQNRSKEALLFEAKQIEQIMLPKVYEIGSIDRFRVQIMMDGFIQSGFIKDIKNRDVDGLIFQGKSTKTAKLNLTDKELDFIAKSKKIVLGTGDEWKPFTIQNADGVITGYDKDVIELINSVSGLKLELLLGDWGQMQKIAKSGEIDGLATGAILPEREEYLNLSKIYNTLQKMIITTKENPKNIESVEGLNNCTIAIDKRNLVDVKIAKRFKESKILQYDTVKDAMNAVITGEADAMFGNGAVLYLANEMGLTFLKNSAYMDEKLELVFGIRKDYPEAINIINKALQYIGSRKLLELKKKWFFIDYKNQLGKTDIDFTTEELNYLERNPVIKVHNEPNWAPYNYNINGIAQGFSIDYMNLLASKVGIQVEYIGGYSWGEYIEMLKDKRIDVMLNIAKTKDRLEYMRFTRPYIRFIDTVVTKSSNEFKNLNDLNDKTVAIVKGYYEEELLKKYYPNIKVLLVKDTLESLKAVAFNQADATINGFGVLSYMISKYDIPNVKVLFAISDKRFNLDLHMATNRDNRILRDILDKGLSKITEGEKRTLRNRWLTKADDFDYSLIIKITIFILLIVSIGVFWNIRLNQKVKREVEKNLKQREMIFQQNKMASMGEMIGNIAHQWRQPLSVISVAIDILMTRSSHGTLDKEKLDSKLYLIEKNVLQMSQTIEDFLSFFSPLKDKTDFLLVDAIDKVLDIMNPHIYKKGIKLELDINSSIKIYGFKDEYIQVLITILANAIQAFDKQEHKLILIESSFVEHGIKLDIIDNAGGIDDSILDKLFEPYFTTKHKSNGTGLGLYISKMIIEESMHGRLSVQNVIGGAMFSIEIESDKVV